MSGTSADPSFLWAADPRFFVPEDLFVALPEALREARFFVAMELSLAQKLGRQRQTLYVVWLCSQTSTISGSMIGRLRVLSERKAERSRRMAFFSSPQSMTCRLAVFSRVCVTMPMDSSTRPFWA